MSFAGLIYVPLTALLATTVRAAEGGGQPQHGGYKAGAGESAADVENSNISHWLLWTWASLIVVLIAYQLILRLITYIRTIACLNNDTQRYFATPNAAYGSLKRHMLDAPLFRLRHNREFKLSAAINMGTLPGRFQTIFLAGYLAMNVAFCVISIDWNGKRPVVLSELRNRTGTLAVINMIPLFLLAGRNNVLIKWCGITFDTFNLIHRWIGRIVVLEAIAHTLAWMINKVETAGWKVVGQAMARSQLIMTGTIGIVAFIVVLFQSPSAIRHAFYEVFLHLHIVLAALATGAVWIHVKNLWHIQLLQTVVAIWALERLTRVVTIIYRNVGKCGTQAQVQVLPGDAVLVTLKMARPWKFQPGQHAYIYLPSVGWWTSHPFSLAWSDEEDDLNSEKGLAMNRQDILDMRKTTVSFIVRRRTGFTDQLYKRADLAPGGRFTTNAIVEGPYGSQAHHSYGTVMLFAAGVGITHQVPHVRDLVTGFSNGTVAARKVILVWIIQSPEHLEWIRPWMTTILGLPRRREVLKILLFVTRPRSTKEIHSPSSSVQMFPGKPNVAALVDAEAENAVGAMCVSVCGTGGLADDVRRASRRWMGRNHVDFIEESFSW